MTIPSWCRVGAKVVCVKRGIHETNRDVVVYPNVGSTYTIREVFEHPYGEPGIRLREIVNPILLYDQGGYMEAGWVVRRFRPLVEDSEQDGIEAQLFRSKGLKVDQREAERA